MGVGRWGQGGKVGQGGQAGLLGQAGRVAGKQPGQAGRWQSPGVQAGKAGWGNNAKPNHHYRVRMNEYTGGNLTTGNNTTFTVWVKNAAPE